MVSLYLLCLHLSVFPRTIQLRGTVLHRVVSLLGPAVKGGEREQITRALDCPSSLQVLLLPFRYGFLFMGLKQLSLLRVEPSLNFALQVQKLFSVLN